MNKKTRLMASLKIWLVIYPSITLFLAVFGESLAGLPLYQRTFVLTATLVPWMMFVGVPLLELLIAQFSGKASAK
ncbi:MAG: hypothetical protein RIE86_06415 [Imperialibacter sp.]|uniref:hypothetical protein n=1 Tax=Imperialibacter sp. TaxID=2038411 RepID=UPI0032EE3E7D